MMDYARSDELVDVHLKSGEIKEALIEDGGGMFIGGDRYEVHFFDVDDGIVTIYQDDIEKVTSRDSGEEVEFGNPYMIGHPRQKGL